MKEKGPCAEQKAELLFCLLRSSCCQDKKLTPRQCLEPGNFPSECALARRAFHLCCLQPVDKKARLTGFKYTASK
uniref:SJCHGC09774 protein n=1 Tax=Schistosoma japonicum TaxID=6182 RepID=Q5BQX2_SCHJA|nr:SJCHGC09774 protein [Schistosoma japonicum]